MNNEIVDERERDQQRMHLESVLNKEIQDTENIIIKFRYK